MLAFHKSFLDEIMQRLANGEIGHLKSLGQITFRGKPIARTIRSAQNVTPDLLGREEILGPLFGGTARHSHGIYGFKLIHSQFLEL